MRTLPIRSALAVVLVAAAAAGISIACGDDDDGGADPGGLRVVATTTQIGALVREVAPDVELTVLLAAGADAHDFEPSPQAIADVGDADIVFMNGIGLDSWLDAMIEGAGGDARLVVTTEGIGLLVTEGEEDPHVWHDPANAKLMVTNIAAALAEADPANAAVFAANRDAYNARLDDVDAEIAALMEAIPAANRTIVTNHDALGYFIRRYGLELAGAIIPGGSPDAQPSAQSLAELTTIIRTSGVKAIFAESEVDPKVAEQLADDTGVKVVQGLYADSLGEPGSGAETVDGMLLANAQKISEALK